MSFSKLTLLAVASAFVAGPVAAHADSLILGNAGESMKFSINNHTETAAGGNFSPSSAVIGGKTVNFDAVYCVDLFDTINVNKTYNGVTFTTTGVVNNQLVTNKNQIAWLLLNIEATTADQQAACKLPSGRRNTEMPSTSSPVAQLPRTRRQTSMLSATPAATRRLCIPMSIGSRRPTPPKAGARMSPTITSRVSLAYPILPPSQSQVRSPYSEPASLASQVCFAAA